MLLIPLVKRHALIRVILQACSPVKQLFDNVRKIVTAISRSGPLHHELSSLARLLRIRRRVLVLDVATRWNSSLFMLESVLALRDALQQLEDKITTTQARQASRALPSLPYVLKEEDWKLITDLVILLRPAARATTVSEGEYYVSLSIAVVMVLYQMKADWRSCLSPEAAFRAGMPHHYPHRYWKRFRQVLLDKFYGETGGSRQLSMFLFSCHCSGVG